MRRPLFLLIVTLLVLRAMDACAEPFQLFGVKFGMSREQVGEKWAPLENGTYYVENSVLFDVSGQFDETDKLYALTFSIPFPEDIPQEVSGKAFQVLATRLWGSTGQTVTFRMGRGNGTATVTDIQLLNEYHARVQKQLETMLRP